MFRFKLFLLAAFIALTAAEFIDDDTAEEYRSRPANPRQFPWHAAVFVNQGTSGERIGSGALISPRHVATVATLVQGVRSKRVTIRFGSQFGEGAPLPISAILLHPRYRPKANSDNNIAVLRLTELVKVSESLRPIPIAKSSSNIEKQQVTISGFGSNGT